MMQISGMTQEKSFHLDQEGNETGWIFNAEISSYLGFAIIVFENQLCDLVSGIIFLICKIHI